jgi:hypothetical protein
VNQSVRVTCGRIEELLGKSHAFRKVDACFYLVRQGSAYIHIHVVPWEGRASHAAGGPPGRALVRFVAQLARGVEMNPDLAIRLLRLNATLRFGSFGWVREGSCVTLQHTLLGGPALDGDELLATLRDLAVLADEYDDRIVADAGGQTMQTIVEEHELAAMRDAVLGEVAWEPAKEK